ncbi:hypothetical protein CB1_117170001 [Camelus ferus]|nr:hypothetical protein CB1_117170001 [Camelus ferus]
MSRCVLVHEVWTAFQKSCSGVSVPYRMDPNPLPGSRSPTDTQLDSPPCTGHEFSGRLKICSQKTRTPVLLPQVAALALLVSMDPVEFSPP